MIQSLLEYDRAEENNNDDAYPVDDTVDEVTELKNSE
jgi:hypothetical protein